MKKILIFLLLIIILPIVNAEFILTAEDYRTNSAIQNFTVTPHETYNESEFLIYEETVDNNDEVWSFTGHDYTVYHVNVDSDGYVYSGSMDNTLRKIDSNGNEVWKFEQGSSVYDLAVGSDGFVYISGGMDNIVRKIDSNGNEVWSFTGHSERVFGVAVDEDGFVYSASWDETLRKIDSSGNQVWSFTGHTDIVRDVTVDSDGFVYSASHDNTLRKIDSNGNQVWKFEGHSSNVRAVAVDSDGFVYSGSNDGTVRKIDSNGNQVWSFTGHTSMVWGVVVDSDGFVYSASWDDTVRKIDSSGNQVWSFTGHTYGVRGVAVDSDGFVYSASEDKTVRKFNNKGFIIGGETYYDGTPAGFANYSTHATHFKVLYDNKLYDIHSGCINNEEFIYTSDFSDKTLYCFQEPGVARGIIYDDDEYLEDGFYLVNKDFVYETYNGSINTEINLSYNQPINFTFSSEENGGYFNRKYDNFNIANNNSLTGILGQVYVNAIKNEWTQEPLQNFSLRYKDSFEQNFDGWTPGHINHGNPIRTTSWSSDGNWSIKLNSYAIFSIGGGGGSGHNYIEKQMNTNGNMKYDVFIKDEYSDILVLINGNIVKSHTEQGLFLNENINFSNGDIVKFRAVSASGDRYVDNIRYENIPENDTFRSNLNNPTLDFYEDEITLTFGSREDGGYINNTISQPIIDFNNYTVHLYQALINFRAVDVRDNYLNNFTYKWNDTDELTTDGDTSPYHGVTFGTYQFEFINDDINTIPKNINRTISESGQQTITFTSIGYNTKFNLLNERTREPFDFNKPESTTLLVYCPGTTEEYDITSSIHSETIPITCDYEKIKFLLDYGDGLSYYRNYIGYNGEIYNQTLYLIDANNTFFVFTSFAIDDLLGRYTNPSIWIRKIIGDQTQTIQSDYTDIESKVSTYLIREDEYIIEVRSENRPTKVLGTYTADSPQAKSINMYELSLDTEQTGGFQNIIPFSQLINDSGTKSIQFKYTDQESQTQQVQFKLYANDINSTPIYTSSIYKESNVELLVPIPTNNVNDIVYAEIDFLHNQLGQRTSTRQHNVDFNVRLRIQDHVNPEFLSWTLLLLLSVTAIFTNIKTPLASIGVISLAFIFAIFGWLQISIGVIVLGILVGILDFMANRR